MSYKFKNDVKLEKLQVEKNELANKIDIDKDLRLETINKEMATTLKSIERENFERDINYLENLKNVKGKSAAIFGLKGKILGNKKKPQERVVLHDPETGKDISSPEGIKRVSLNYLVDLLTNKTVKEEYADVLNAKCELHFNRMEEVIDEDIEELTSVQFEKTLIALSKKPGNKYNFITKAGYSLKLALLNLFQIIWRSEKIPLKWHESNIIQLSKGRQGLNSLDNIGHIHDRNIYFKFFVKL